MTAKEFVLKHLPTAKAERHLSGRIKGLQTTYYLIRERGKYIYFSEGKTESNAWVSAKNKIIELKIHLK